MVWKNIGSLSGNQVLNGDGFYISYATGAGLAVIGLFGSDDDSDETALVVPNDAGGKDFFILNGDYRADYEKLTPEGLDACKAFYETHKDKVSSWSD